MQPVVYIIDIDKYNRLVVATADGITILKNDFYVEMCSEHCKMIDCLYTPKDLREPHKRPKYSQEGETDF